MGTCCSGKKPNAERDTLTQFQVNLPPNHLIYKTRTDSNRLIIFDTKQKLCTEFECNIPYQFKNMQLTWEIRRGQLLCVGGEGEELWGMLLNIDQRLAKPIRPPPNPLWGGAAYHFQQKVYFIGGVSQEFLCYDIYKDEWENLETQKVAFVGSCLVESHIITFGGFQNYDTQPTPSHSIMYFNIPERRWSVGNITCPLSIGSFKTTILPNSEILFIGGTDIQDSETEKCFIYNGSTFEQTASLPCEGGLIFNDPATVYENKVYIFSEDETLFIFNIETKKWEAVDVEELLYNNSVPSSQILPKRKPGTFTYHYNAKDSDLLEYDTMKNSARNTQITQFTHIKNSGMWILSNGNLLFIGGQDDDDLYINTCWAYDTSSKLEFEVASLPEATAYCRAIEVDGIVYSLAGYEIVCDNLGERMQTHWFSYSIEEDKWDALPDMPSITILPGVAHLNGNIYAIGGLTNSDRSISYNQIASYDIAGQQWVKHSVSYEHNVTNLGVVTLPSNQMLWYGGDSRGGGNVKNVYLFDGTNFTEILEMEAGCTGFQESGVIHDELMYSFSKDGTLWCFDLNAKTWDIIHLNITNRN